MEINFIPLIDRDGEDPPEQPTHWPTESPPVQGDKLILGSVVWTVAARVWHLTGPRLRIDLYLDRDGESTAEIRRLQMKPVAGR